MEKLFKLKAHGTDVKTEIRAGITTFFAMAYIIFVNSNYLSMTGMNKTGVMVATCISAAIGCLLTAFLANVPFCRHPAWASIPSSPLPYALAWATPGSRLWRSYLFPACSSSS